MWTQGGQKGIEMIEFLELCLIAVFITIVLIMADMSLSGDISQEERDNGTD